MTKGLTLSNIEKTDNPPPSLPTHLLEPPDTDYETPKELKQAFLNFIYSGTITGQHTPAPTALEETGEEPNEEALKSLMEAESELWKPPEK